MQKKQCRSETDLQHLSNCHAIRELNLEKEFGNRHGYLSVVKRRKREDLVE